MHHCAVGYCKVRSTSLPSPMCCIVRPCIAADDDDDDKNYFLIVVVVAIQWFMQCKLSSSGNKLL